MSMSFKDSLSPEQAKMMRELFNVEADDGREFLLNDAIFNSKVGGDVARMTGQVATLEINETGEIKTLSDGTKYRLEKTGWKKI